MKLTDVQSESELDAATADNARLRKALAASIHTANRCPYCDGDEEVHEGQCEIPSLLAWLAAEGAK